MVLRRRFDKGNSKEECQALLSLPMYPGALRGCTDFRGSRLCHRGLLNNNILNNRIFNNRLLNNRFPNNSILNISILDNRLLN